MSVVTTDWGPAPQVALPDAHDGGGIEPVVAWRVWRVGFRRVGLRTTEPFLRAISDNEPWAPRQPKRAACRTRDHVAPSLDCRCGIYGMAEPAPPPYGLPSAGFIAVGEVALWGDVQLHPSGYRASFGYPKRLGLFCTRCLEVRRAVEASIVVADSPYGPLCHRHRGLSGEPVDPILAALLDDYDVASLPPDVLGRAIAIAKEPPMDVSFWRGLASPP